MGIYFLVLVVLLTFVYLGATQIVMGQTTGSWPRELLQGSILRDVLGRIKDVDVYIVGGASS